MHRPVFEVEMSLFLSPYKTVAVRVISREQVAPARYTNMKVHGQISPLFSVYSSWVGNRHRNRKHCFKNH